jgi:hypothetical protein
MNCVINQPNYIPWRGYFHQIRKADIFVFYDDVQYDKHGWRNRNRVKTPNGPVWLSIPVRNKGVVENRIAINEIAIDWTKDWARKHWMTIQQSYGKAPFFSDYASELEAFYANRYELLADLTIDLTIAIASKLGITKTKFIRSSTLKAPGTKTDRLLGILKSVEATHYISGPAARDYLDEAMLSREGISLEYMVYDYPSYPQLYPPYDPNVTILDLLFMMGNNASRQIWQDPDVQP